MSRARVLVALAVPFALASGCVLGSEQAPGCRNDHPEDCPRSWVCRGGVCLRPTTSLSPASDADASDVDVLDAEAEEG